MLLSQFNYTIGSLNPETMTGLLRSSSRDTLSNCIVSELKIEQVGAGQMACSYRVTLKYQQGYGPSSVVVKLPSDNVSSKAFAVQTGAYLREVNFYNNLVDKIGARTPACFYGNIDANLGDFVLVLEDMTPTSTVDQLSGATPDQAASALEQAALLHGKTWRSPIVEASWLPTDEVWTTIAASVPASVTPWLERFGAYLDREQVAAVEELAHHASAWVATLRNHRSLWHGDFRLDNMLFNARDGADPIAIVDWQSVASGPGTIDVSYFMGNSLSADNRSTHERDLLKVYFDRLVSMGVNEVDFDELWLEYRAHALFGLILIVPISLGVKQTDRGDAMFGAMASRTTSQIVELASYGALSTILAE